MTCSLLCLDLLTVSSVGLCPLSLPAETATSVVHACRSITPLPKLFCVVQGYLWTLKCCHGGADMDTAAEMAKGAMDGDTVWMVFDMLQNR